MRRFITTDHGRKSVQDGGRGAEGKVPCCGKMGSMAWKNGENDFHGVEVSQSDDSPRGAGGKGDEFGFHGVEVLSKVGSMAWKNGTIWVPCHGKTANLTSMAWKTKR